MRNKIKLDNAIETIKARMEFAREKRRKLTKKRDANAWQSVEYRDAMCQMWYELGRIHGLDDAMMVMIDEYFDKESDDGLL